MKGLLRALLLLYPRSHRHAYGAEMLAVAGYRWRRARGSWRARIGVPFDFAFGAVTVWGDRLGRTMMGTGRGWGLDARFVIRSLLRSPGYAATAVVILACAVAATATVFSFVRGTLLNEPPYPNPERVVVVWGSNVESGQLRDVVSGPAYVRMQEETSTFEHLAAFHVGGASLTVDGHPEVLDALEVSSEFFQALEIGPALGRVFDARDRMSGVEETVILTHAFWRDRLASDPAVLGTRLPFTGAPRTVVGVLPEGFEFVAPAPVFVPLRDDVLAADDPGHIHYNVLGRLRPDVPLPAVATDLARVASGFVDTYPRFEGWSFRVEPLHEVTVEAVRSVIWILAGTVSLVLLVALVNLATLFRIRALARGNEFGVRVALGAGWRRVARVLSMEAMALAALGAALGLLAAPFLLERVAAMLPEWIAIPESAARVPVLKGVLDPPVAAVTFLSAVLGALVLAAPSLLVAIAPEGARRTNRVHGGVRGTRLLVGVEVAVATVLCVGAALLVRSADNLLSVDVGLEHEGLLTLYFGDTWDLDPADRVTYFRAAVDAVEALPGVERAGVTGYIDFQAEDDFARVYFLDRSFQPVRDVREEWRRVDEGLFEAAGMSIVSGRSFTTRDFEGTPRTAVVNEAFAAKHWPDGAPVGSFLSTHNSRYRDLEVVGVVADVRSLGPATPPPPMLYVPYQGDPRGTQGLYVKMSGDPMSQAAAVREAIWSVDSSQPVAEIAPMSNLVNSWVAVPRASRTLILGLAGLSLLLSAVGVFGVVSFAVRSRRSELGVRLALGASPERLELEQMRTIVPIVVLGLTGGVAIGLAGARVARDLLYGVDPGDPVSVATGLAAMTLAALLAAYLPARRVGRIDPTEAIRQE